ncbi:MAG: hypothetical protein FXF54_07090 [Kosmotoga sp.]|nr:MAG: hypothetical protein FXF54_07090 [Kosmotoga sp.]
MKLIGLLMLFLIVPLFFYANTLSLEIFHSDFFKYEGLEYVACDGGTIKYYTTPTGKLLNEYGLSFSYIEKRSSDFFDEIKVPMMTKVYYGTVFDSSPDGVFGYKVGNRTGLMAAGFEKFGLYYGLFPELYLRLQAVYVSLGTGIEIGNFFNGETISSWEVNLELGYTF